MENDRDCRERLRCKRKWVETGERTEGLKSRGDIRRRIRVERSAPALVPGIECLEELADVCASAFADDDPIGPHAQALPDEGREADLSHALRISVARLKVHDVRMSGPQLGGVFDDNDALAEIDGAEHRPE